MKKIISSCVLVFCLFCSKAFSQVIVSGEKVKESITYNSVEEIKKNARKIKKFANLAVVELKFPVGSSLRNEESFKIIFGQILKEIPYSFDYDRDFAPYTDPKNRHPTITVANCIKQFDDNNLDIIFRFYIPEQYNGASYDRAMHLEKYNLWTPEQFSRKYIAQLEKERNANKAAGYGYITNAERDVLLTKKQEEQKVKKEQLKPQIDELIKKGKEYENQKRYYYAFRFYEQAMDLEHANGIELGDGEIAFALFRTPMEWTERDYDVFTIHEAQELYWRKDRDRFITEYPIFEMYYAPKIERTNINYDKKTADYLVNLLYIGNYREQTMYKQSQVTVKSMPEYENPNTVNSSITKKLIPEIEKIYRDEKIALFVLAGFPSDWLSQTRNRIYQNNLACFETIPNVYHKEKTNYFSNVATDYYKKSLYEIKFDLYDKNGKLIKQGTRQSVDASLQIEWFAYGSYLQEKDP